MDLAWFVYTLAIIMVAIMACATSMTLWVITERRDCIYAVVAFASYVFSTSIILFDEYIQIKSPLEVYFTETGLLHPWIEVPLGVILVAAAWAWCLARLHIKVDRTRFAIAVALFLVVEVAFAPVMGHAGRLRTIMFWGIRDLALIAAVVFGFWYVRRNPEDACKLGLDKSARFYGVVLALFVVMLVEDLANIVILRPDFNNPLVERFFWHLSERNLTENVAMVVLAVRKMLYNRDIMRVYAQHPAEKAEVWDDQRVAHDFDTRLLRYCDAKGMSVRERDVVQLAIKGKDTQGIASELYISPGTVKAHMHRIYTKAGVTSRQELVSDFWKF